VTEIAVQEADGSTKSYPHLFQKATRDRPCPQINVGSYLILLGRGGIQQVCGVADCGCFLLSSRPFRAQNERKPRILEGRDSKGDIHSSLHQLPKYRTHWAL